MMEIDSDDVVHYKAVEIMELDGFAAVMKKERSEPRVAFPC